MYAQTNKKLNKTKNNNKKKKNGKLKETYHMFGILKDHKVGYVSSNNQKYIFQGDQF